MSVIANIECYISQFNAKSFWKVFLSDKMVWAMITDELVYRIQGHTNGTDISVEIMKTARIPPPANN